jgi:type VI protein secretion system component VasK
VYIFIFVILGVLTLWLVVSLIRGMISGKTREEGVTRAFVYAAALSLLWYFAVVFYHVDSAIERVRVRRTAAAAVVTPQEMVAQAKEKIEQIERDLVEVRRLARELEKDGRCSRCGAGLNENGD